MKKSIKKKLPVIGAAVFLLAAFVCMYLMTKAVPGSDEQFWLQVIAVLCLALSGVCIASDNRGKKLKEFFEKVREAIQEFVEKLVTKLANLLGLTGGRGYGDKRFLQEYTDVSVKVGKNPSKKKKFSKKYKDMNNRERIRFFYSKLMNRQIKKGYRFKSSRTASEHGEILLKYEKISQEGQQLFDSYNVARYDTRGIITEENVEKVKKICKKY